MEKNKELNYQVLFTNDYQTYIYQGEILVKKCSIRSYFKELKKKINKLQVHNFSVFDKEIQYDCVEGVVKHFSISLDSLTERELFEFRSLVDFSDACESKEKLKNKDKKVKRKREYLLNYFSKCFKEGLNKKKTHFLNAWDFKVCNYSIWSLMAVILNIIFVSSYPGILINSLLSCQSFLQGLLSFGNITLGFLVAVIIKNTFIPVICTIKEGIRVLQNQKYYEPLNFSHLKRVVEVRKSKSKGIQSFKELVFEEVKIIGRDIDQLEIDKQQEYGKILLSFLEEYKKKIQSFRNSDSILILENEDCINQNFYQKLLKLEMEIKFVLEHNFSKQQELYDRQVGELEQRLREQLNLNDIEQTEKLTR